MHRSTRRKVHWGAFVPLIKIISIENNSFFLFIWTFYCRSSRGTSFFPQGSDRTERKQIFLGPTPPPPPPPFFFHYFCFLPSARRNKNPRFSFSLLHQIYRFFFSHRSSLPFSSFRSIPRASLHETFELKSRFSSLHKCRIFSSEERVLLLFSSAFFRCRIVARNETFWIKSRFSSFSASNIERRTLSTFSFSSPVFFLQFHETKHTRRNFSSLHTLNNWDNVQQCFFFFRPGISKGNI